MSAGSSIVVYSSLNSIFVMLRPMFELEKNARSKSREKSKSKVWGETESKLDPRSFSAESVKSISMGAVPPVKVTRACVGL